MLYGRESITLDDVQSTLNLKELNQKSELKNSGSGVGLYARGKSEKMESHKSSKGKSRSKSQSDSMKNAHDTGAIFQVGSAEGRRYCEDETKTTPGRCYTGGLGPLYP
uniref:Uncharacterized protein n=1 Tax=Cannabis sativa TaxID=3483 RepID=A0A803P6G8_CANSA